MKKHFNFNKYTSRKLPFYGRSFTFNSIIYKSNRRTKWN